MPLLRLEDARVAVVPGGHWGGLRNGTTRLWDRRRQAIPEELRWVLAEKKTKVVDPKSFVLILDRFRTLHIGGAWWDVWVLPPSYQDEAQHLGVTGLFVHYWFANEKVYSTKDADLTAADVHALAHEAANRRRLQLEKAHSLADMAVALDTKSKRKPIPKAVRIEVWQRDSGRCVECGSQSALEFDHIIPVSFGGADTARNLQLLCETCNRRKGASLG